MTLIKRPSEIQFASKIKMLIYGQAGQGKTTMACSAPKPLLIDCDGGVQRINPAHMVPVVQVKSYDEILEVLTTEDLSEFESIVIDTGGKLLDLMAAYIIAHNPKMGKANGALTLQGYGERKAEFTQFCKLVTSKNKHLIFVAHRETRTEGDDTRYVPLFGGSNYDALVTELDLVGYLEANGKKPVITFNGTSRNDGKNTCNLPPVIDVPCVVGPNGDGMPNRFLQDVVFPAYEKHLDSIAAIGRAYAEVMETLKEQIAMITDELSANDFISLIDSFKHVGSSKAAAGRLLAAKCKELKLKYNKEAGKYEPAA